MTIPLLLLLLIAAGLFAWRDRRRVAAGMLIAVLTAVILIGCGLLPKWLLHQVQPPTSSAIAWSPHNSIAVLGAGTMAVAPPLGPRIPFFGYSRVAVAAQIYRECRAHSADCKIVVSGGDPQHHGRSEAATYADTLVRLGVPPSHIQLEDKSNNTWQNAANTTGMVEPDRRLVVVASGFQLQRALLYFAHFRNAVVGWPSDELEVDLTPVPSAMNFLLTDILLHEEIGIARYHVYNMLGWNPPTTVSR